MKKPTLSPIEDISIICIGNELLNGQILNTNLQFLGNICAENGIIIHREICIADGENDIINTITPLLQNNHIIITIGGLGVTSDDITKICIANLTNRELVFDSEEGERIRQLMVSKQRKVKEDYIQNQARIISGCQKLANPNGSAVGMAIQYSSEGTIFMLPGPPHEFQPMVKNELLPKLLASRHSTIINQVHYFANITESEVADIVEPICADYPHIEIAYCAAPRQVRLTLRTSIDFQEEIENAWQKIGTALFPYLLPENCINLPQALAYYLKQLNYQMGTAESCTGGLIAKLLTDEAGSSSWYHGSLITYDNEWKHRLLSIPYEKLNQYGAVSQETASAMINGLLKNYPIHAGITVTGIAGPDGGTEEKPVGLVYIGTGTPYVQTVKKYLFNGSRETIRYQTAMSGMLQLLLDLQKTDALIHQQLFA